MRTCSPLKAPKFGSVHPSLCKSLPTSGTTCYFECNHGGFLADGGVKTAFCGTDGNWNMNETSILKCRGKPYIYIFFLFLSVFNKKNLHGITLVISNK